ncbi:Disintegrin and metalloproteinase domain-containing protein 25 [Tupaia chinensis]|uniref:Disintegrin and metalloproteinase domain-containing protein 25 n=1 Tax=Tupaia chinensis TaxID=246437 RepID=L9KR87_TUPCH|nr:Disintegrin and metalloproteinase domain-containing protein 25 [Tupaia chinensis]
MAHGWVTLLPLLLGVFLFLCRWPQIGHCQHHSPPEVVIPLRVPGKDKVMKVPGWVSYSLHFGGQRHIVHMKPKKFLVSRSLSVFTYTDQGALVEDQPFVRPDCYYQGYVEGDAESLVALSTCLGGFQGVLHINDIAYEIKPKRHSATFEHLVYKMDHEESEFPSMRCGLTDDIAQQFTFQESDNYTLMQSGYVGWWTHRRYVELAVVVDQQRFIHRGSNVSKVQEEVSIIVNAINVLYIATEVDVLLLGIEIWTTGNLIKGNDIATVLRQFQQWKIKSFNPRMKHDVAHLFIKRAFGLDLGHAYIGTVCNYNYNCGVDSLMDDNIAKHSAIVAHEMGHNMGMYHDRHYCTCGHRTCIMSQTESHVTAFSNCSYAAMWSVLMKTTCTHYAPNPEDIFKVRRCGNGVVEEGEQCDCGSLQSCKHDPCCSANCTLMPGAACAFGLCCQDCQILPSGEVCRESDNECDLPEWCNGTSPECPEDVYVQAGVPCMDGGYCYGKRCNDRDLQCRDIFGEISKSASLNCYRILNMRGDRFGNCGTQNARYVRCNITDILCGRIQCENVTALPFLRDHSTAHWTRFSGDDCWSTDYHFGMTIPDVGEIKDGTLCGSDRVCIQRKCTSMSVLKSNCSLTTCNKRGFCNNKHHCHCTFQWEPPYCLLEGNGGSVDSGPPPQRKEELNGHHGSSLNLLVWIRICAFLGCALILIVIRCKKS